MVILLDPNYVYIYTLHLLVHLPVSQSCTPLLRDISYRDSHDHHADASEYFFL